nr:GFA family protein [Salinihabitans flavidus]
MIHCHCNFCQRATGSAYLIETLFAKEQFRLLHGTPRVFIHTSIRARAAASAFMFVSATSAGPRHICCSSDFRIPSGVYSDTFDKKDWFVRRPEKALYFYLSNAPVGKVLPSGHQVFDAHYWRSDGVAADAQIFDVHTLVTEHLKAESKKRLRDHEH